MTESARGRVLVVDDEPQVGQALRRLLRAVADVDIEPRALDALARLRAGEQFDLVLCDVQLPGVRGPDFLRCVQRFIPAAAESVVLMTGGDTCSEPWARCLSKPFHAEALCALVRARVSERERAWCAR